MPKGIGIYIQLDDHKKEQSKNSLSTKRENVYFLSCRWRDNEETKYRVLHLIRCHTLFIMSVTLCLVSRMHFIYIWYRIHLTALFYNIKSSLFDLLFFEFLYIYWNGNHLSVSNSNSLELNKLYILLFFFGTYYRWKEHSSKLFL